MWILRKINDEDTVFRIISSKGSYTVGRKNKDIILEDESISRSHCTIFVAKKNDCPFPVNTFTGIWVVDDGSKYGTFLKQKDFEKIKNKTNTKLEQNAIVRFGLLENVFRVQYRPIIACTSMLTKAETEECIKILNEIDGILRANFVEQCSLVIVNSITLTKKVLLGLINGVPIVLPDYLKKLADSIKNNTPLPDYKAFKPPIAEKALKGNLVSLDIKDTRKELFKGKLFILPTKSQIANLSEVIEAAGGKFQKLDINGNWNKFGGDNIVVVKHPLNAPAEIVNIYKKNTQMLKEKYNKRVVPESEIPQAIAYSSVERFCNPECIFDIRKSFEENSKGEVIEEETPSVSEQAMEEACTNFVPGSSVENESEPNSISILDFEKPGDSSNKKRGLSPEIPTPSKRRTTERNLSVTPSQLVSQSLMNNEKTQQAEKTKNDSNNKILEKRPSAANRPIIQIESNPIDDDFWASPNSSQASQKSKRKISENKSPPEVEQVSKKTRAASLILDKVAPSTSKNNETAKRSRKSKSPEISPPQVEPANRKTRAASRILDKVEPPTSKNNETAKRSRKSKSPEISPPEIEPVNKKTRAASRILDKVEPSTSKNNETTKRGRKSPSPEISPPHIEPANKRAKTSSGISNEMPGPSTSAKSNDIALNGRKSPSPTSNSSDYHKPTISNNMDEDGWITVSSEDWDGKEEVKNELKEELNSTVIMLNLISVSYRDEEGIKEPPSGLKNVKRFRKQKYQSTKESVPVEPVEDYDENEDDWTYVKTFSQEML